MRRARTHSKLVRDSANIYRGDFIRCVMHLGAQRRTYGLVGSPYLFWPRPMGVAKCSPFPAARAAAGLFRGRRPGHEKARPVGVSAGRTPYAPRSAKRGARADDLLDRDSTAPAEPEMGHRLHVLPHLGRLGVCFLLTGCLGQQVYLLAATALEDRPMKQNRIS